MLQWGRNFIVAEIRQLGIHDQHDVRASMGPQLYRCGNVCSEHCGPYTADKRLQWGRNFIVAETDAYHAESRRTLVASMGPQLYRCGNSPPPGPTYPMGHLLQWGRNFIVAEIILPDGSIPHSRPLRFNGAATLSLRKRQYRGCPWKLRKAPASMGPQLYRCGNTATHGLPAPLYRASMGPQLYRCGNAEEDRSNQLIFNLASMGPQLYRCGNCVKVGTFRGAGQVASMGPQLYRCGNSAILPSGRTRGLVASMGPQLYRCGNSSVVEVCFTPM